MSTDPDKLAIEAEADRLAGVYVRIRLLAQAQGIDVIEAGRHAVAKGVVTAADWELVREAISER
jgi:hypothetical protein